MAAWLLALATLGAQGPAPAQASVAPGAEGAVVPWYDRPACMRVMREILGGALDAAERSLVRLEVSKDPDDRACAVFNRVLRAEMLIAFDGMTPGHVEHREFYLTQMVGLARQYASLGRRFADLEIEAWTRRVRTYFDAGRKLDAVSAARTANAMLAERGGDPPSPTVDLVEGAFGSAVGHSPLPLRALFRMAGISGDIDRGAAALRRLTEGSTVYKYDAMYMAHHFTREREDSPLGRPVDWASRLYRAFPTNPQYLFDVGMAWHDMGRCSEVLKTLRPHLESFVGAAPPWTPHVRTKLQWLAAKCALATGDAAGARTYLERAEKERFAPWAETLAELRAELTP